MDSPKHPSDEQPISAYEAPKVSDYGTLLELTLGGHLKNGDVPHGTNNAYS